MMSFDGVDANPVSSHGLIGSVVERIGSAPQVRKDKFNTAGFYEWGFALGDAASLQLQA